MVKLLCSGGGESRGRWTQPRPGPSLSPVTSQYRQSLSLSLTCCPASQPALVATQPVSQPASTGLDCSEPPGWVGGRVRRELWLWGEK